VALSSLLLLVNVPPTSALHTLSLHDALPIFDIGAITIAGLHDVHESLVRERLLVHTGERYSPSRIEKARQDLFSLGVFAGVSVRAAPELDPEGRIPITFDVQERLQHVVGLTA